MYPPVGLVTCHFSGTVDPPFTTFNAFGLTGGRSPPPTANATVTLKLPVATLRCASVDVQFGVARPGWKTEPELGVQCTAPVPSTRPVADVGKDTVAPAALVAMADRFAGSVMTGAVVSCTLTLKVPVAAFPCASVAVQVTVVVPM